MNRTQSVFRFVKGVDLSPRLKNQAGLQVGSRLLILDWSFKNIWWLPRYERLTKDMWRVGWLNLAIGVARV